MPETSSNGVAERRYAGPSSRSADFRVFIDFDNTITLGDVLDGVIQRFAGDDSWRTLEEDWAAGRIGARACLDGQLRTLRAEWPEFARHLDGVTLDPGFAGLRDFLRRQRIEMTILTDNFDMFVRYILQQRGLSDVPLRANHLECRGNQVLPSFPFANPDCPECAHCKKTHFLPPNQDDRRVVYIGDGRSDLCPARHADVVFAKATLLRQLRAEGRPCIPFASLHEVTAALLPLIHERTN